MSNTVFYSDSLINPTTFSKSCSETVVFVCFLGFLLQGLFFSDIQVQIFFPLIQIIIPLPQDFKGMKCIFPLGLIRLNIVTVMPSNGIIHFNLKA